MERPHASPPPLRFDDDDDDEFDDDDDDNRADAAALRILASWIAMHDRTESAGAVVDRDFVVGERPS